MEMPNPGHHISHRITLSAMRDTDPQPPAGFTVPERLRPAPATINGSPSASAGTASASAPSTKAQSLIDRYNLSSKLAAVSPAAPAPAPLSPAGGGGGKWEANREDREKELRARKERMILEARR